MKSNPLARRLHALEARTVAASRHPLADLSDAELQEVARRACEQTAAWCAERLALMDEKTRAELGPKLAARHDDPDALCQKLKAVVAIHRAALLR